MPRRTLQEVLILHRLQRLELQAWIDQRWVRPQIEAAQPVFDDADEARIALICELRREFMIDDEALEVVLSLLDQLYAARSVLRRVHSAIDSLPPALREELRARLQPTDRP